MPPIANKALMVWQLPRRLARFWGAYWGVSAKCRAVRPRYRAFANCTNHKLRTKYNRLAKLHRTSIGHRHKRRIGKSSRKNRKPSTTHCRDLPTPRRRGSAQKPTIGRHRPAPRRAIFSESSPYIIWRNFPTKDCLWWAFYIFGNTLKKKKYLGKCCRQVPCSNYSFYFSV